MKKPSDEFRVEETNSLLAQVPGMAVFAGKQRVTGGKGPVSDPRDLKVADTNKMVESITGGGLKALQESGPSVSQGHVPIYGGLNEDQQDDVMNKWSAFTAAMDRVTRPALLHSPEWKTAKTLRDKLESILDDLFV